MIFVSNDFRFSFERKLFCSVVSIQQLDYPCQQENSADSIEAISSSG
jgi:hypothetical protein